MADDLESRSRRRRDDHLQDELARVTALVESQQRTISRRLNPVWLGLMLTAAGLMGAFVPAALDFLGVRTTGPGLANEANTKRIDGVEQRIGGIEHDLKETRDLFTAYVTSSCMDSAQIVRLRQALVPCVQLLRERGVSP